MSDLTMRSDGGVMSLVPLRPRSLTEVEATVGASDDESQILPAYNATGSNLITLHEAQRHLAEAAQAGHAAGLQAGHHAVLSEAQQWMAEEAAQRQRLQSRIAELERDLARHSVSQNVQNSCGMPTLFIPTRFAVV